MDLLLHEQHCARITVDDGTPAEREWLAQLATALQIEPELKAHVDAIQTKQPAEAEVLGRWDAYGTPYLDPHHIRCLNDGGIDHAAHVISFLAGAA